MNLLDYKFPNYIFINYLLLINNSNIICNALYRIIYWNINLYRLLFINSIIVVVVFPQDIFEKGFFGENMAMLGLGDIVIPGILIALLLRFDNRFLNNTHTHTHARTRTHTHMHTHTHAHTHAHTRTHTHDIPTTRTHTYTYTRTCTHTHTYTHAHTRTHTHTHTRTHTHTHTQHPLYFTYLLKSY